MSSILTCQQIFSTNKIIPVVVLDDIEKAVAIADALVAGGIAIMEITLRTPNALAIIKQIRSNVPQMIVGAGTVLNDDQYHRAISHGAQFIVSPGLSGELAHVSTEYDIPFLPGAVTPSEIMHAMASGFNYLKFFPAESYNGYSVLKALASPFAEMKFCPTGGISLNNIKQYLSLPNVVGVGCSFLINADAVTNNNFIQITNSAREALDLLK